MTDVVFDAEGITLSSTSKTAKYLPFIAGFSWQTLENGDVHTAISNDMLGVIFNESILHFLAKHPQYLLASFGGGIINNVPEPRDGYKFGLSQYDIAQVMSGVFKQHNSVIHYGPDMHRIRAGTWRGALSVSDMIPSVVIDLLNNALLRLVRWKDLNRDLLLLPPRDDEGRLRFSLQFVTDFYKDETDALPHPHSSAFDAAATADLARLLRAAEPELWQQVSMFSDVNFVRNFLIEKQNIIRTKQQKSTKNIDQSDVLQGSLVARCIHYKPADEQTDNRNPEGLAIQRGFVIGRNPHNLDEFFVLKENALAPFLKVLRELESNTPIAWQDFSKHMYRFDATLSHALFDVKIDPAKIQDQQKKAEELSAAGLSIKGTQAAAYKTLEEMYNTLQGIAAARLDEFCNKYGNYLASQSNKPQRQSFYQWHNASQIQQGILTQFRSLPTWQERADYVQERVEKGYGSEASEKNILTALEEILFREQYAHPEQYQDYPLLSEQNLKKWRDYIRVTAQACLPKNIQKTLSVLDKDLCSRGTSLPKETRNSFIKVAEQVLALQQVFYGQDNEAYWTREPLVGRGFYFSESKAANILTSAGNETIIAHEVSAACVQLSVSLPPDLLVLCEERLTRPVAW